jgi:hypothetical protein
MIAFQMTLHWGYTVTHDRKIKILKILADSCHKHPAYRAKRQVKIDCQPCVVIWNARLELETY